MFSGPVLVGGSRSLLPSSPAGLACSAFVSSLLAAGGLLHVGCATGADQAALSAAVRAVVACRSASFQQVRAFAAFGPGGAGSFSGSAVAAVQAAARAGVPVSWLAGGLLSVPLVARLMARSLAALGGCSAAVFFAPGVGSLKVARAALRAGVPVLVACIGVPSAPVLPVTPMVASWLGVSFWVYRPAQQQALF